MVGKSKEDISDCKNLRDVAMAANFWLKSPKIGANLTCTWYSAIGTLHTISL